MNRLSTINTQVVSLLVLVSLPPAARGQSTLPPDALQQFQHAVGNRVEAVNILAGDYAAAGGIYTFRGGTLADVSVSKVGGGGEVASLRPLGVGSIQWAPVLLGNVGMVSAENQFQTGYLAGNRMTYDTLAIQGGGGAAIHFGDHLSLSPTISGIYGHVENQFDPQTANGDYFRTLGTGTLVDWTMETWSVVPALELEYQWMWRRTTFEFCSRFSYFHTESFETTSPILGVNGDSSTWLNKLDVDVPLGLKVLGRELHAGGFFSRTELFDNVAHGLNSGYVYTVNGRFVIDLQGKLWKVRWLGLGASYFFGEHFDGWTMGMDLRFKF